MISCFILPGSFYTAPDQCRPTHTGLRLKENKRFWALNCPRRWG